MWRKVSIGVAVLFLCVYGAWQLSRARTFQLFGESVPRVETDRRVVALTFDDGPRTDTVDEIRAAGHRGPIHVRAPYCKKLVGLPCYFARNKRVHVTWDIEPESTPEIDADTNRLIANVVDNAKPGSIILLHPWYRGRERSRAAIPAIIENLESKGYAFVTVDELLRMRRT